MIRIGQRRVTGYSRTDRLPARLSGHRPRHIGRYVIYLWLIFIFFGIGGYFKPVSQLEAAEGAGLYLTVACYVVGVIFLCDVIYYWGALWARLPASVAVRLGIGTLFAGVVFATILGGRNGQGVNLTGPAWRSIYWDAVPMLMCGLLVAGANYREFYSRLPRLLLWQSGIATIFVWLVVIKYPIGRARELFGGPHYAAYAVISVSILTFSMLDKYGLFGRIVSLASYLTFAVFNVIYQSRGGFIVTAIILPVIIVGGRLLLIGGKTELRTGFGGYFDSRTLRAALVVAALSATGFLHSGIRAEVTEAWEMTTSRLYGGIQEQSIRVGFAERTREEIERSRGAEAVDYIRQLDVGQVLIGKGFGGAWFSEFWGVDWFIVHFGPLHLVLKGGIALSVGFLVTIGFGLLGSFRGAQVDSLFFGAGAFIVYIFLAFLKHGPFVFSYETVLFWLVLGIGLAGLEFQKGRGRSTV